MKFPARLLLAALLLAAGVAHAQTTITALPAGGALTGTEPIPMDQVGSCSATGGTCKTTPAAILAYIEANIALTSAQILTAFTGTCSSATFLRGDGACAVPSGGLPSGTPAFIGAGGQGTGLGAWASTTLGIQMLGAHILNAMPAFKFSLETTGAGLIVHGAVFRRTPRNVMTGSAYIDSTVITWGSNPTPTFGAGIQVSDTINVALDSAHDGYILIYFAPSTPGGGAVYNWSDAKSGLEGNYQSGDLTAASNPNGFNFSPSVLGVFSVTSP